MCILISIATECISGYVTEPSLSRSSQGPHTTMSAEIVNLRQARKRKSRAEKEAKASENRKFYGQPSSQRRHREAIEALEARALDGKQRITAAAKDEIEHSD